MAFNHETWTKSSRWARYLLLDFSLLRSSTPPIHAVAADRSKRGRFIGARADSEAAPIVRDPAVREIELKGVAGDGGGGGEGSRGGGGGGDS